MMEIACIVICSAVVMLLYTISQIRVITRLIRLLRQPGRVARFELTESCVVTLCILPGMLLPILSASLLLLALIKGSFFLSDERNLLTLLTFSPAGAAFALISWIAMSVWFLHIILRDRAIYREPTALVPVVILALICLTYSLAIAWLFASGILKAWGLSIGQSIPDPITAVAALMLFLVPTAPLIGFVLLIVHVVRVRAARAGEACDAGPDGRGEH